MCGSCYESCGAESFVWHRRLLQQQAPYPAPQCDHTASWIRRHRRTAESPTTNLSRTSVHGEEQVGCTCLEAYGMPPVKVTHSGPWRSLPVYMLRNVCHFGCTGGGTFSPRDQRGPFGVLERTKWKYVLRVEFRSLGRSPAPQNRLPKMRFQCAKKII